MKKLINYIVLLIVGFVFGGLAVGVAECYDERCQKAMDFIIRHVCK